MMRVSPILVSLSLVAACGGEAEVETTETTAESEPATGAEAETEPTEATHPAGVRLRADSEIPRAPEAWEEMTPEEKGHFMGEDVLPYMRELFTEYDADEFGGMSCATCHGPDMQERSFEMPSPSLPALYPSGTPEQEQMVQEHPRMVMFMFRHVVPAMRTMIGAPEYDPETGEGFSCFYCHPEAE